jgi:hypothetical protein
VLCGLAVGIVLLIGVVQAGAQGSTMVLKFYSPPGVQTAVGFSENSNTPPPVGASQVIQLVLENIGSQFGKPSGAKVGHVLLDCTILAVNASAQMVDGVCSGIAHVPDGYLTFGGSLTQTRVNWFDVTGGVGPYANDRGEIKVVNNANGSSDATVTLSS